MIGTPSRGRSAVISALHATCRVLVPGLILAGAYSVAAQAEVKHVKISLDWVIQGTHAPFFVAQEKGYFNAAGVTTLTPSTRATAQPMSPSPSAAALIPSGGSICRR